MEAPESIRGENLKCPACGYSQKVAGENPDLMKPLGNLEPICPYCNKSLKKKPKQRSKCPHCGNYFRVRTRPQDRQQVLVTEEQAEEISRQYYEGYGRDPENWLQEKRKIWDQQWGDLNKQSGEYAKSGSWGLYRNCRYQMGDVLRMEVFFILTTLKFSKEEKHGIQAISRMKQAIKMYLEVALFDLNGANNSNEFKPCENRIQFYDMAPAVMDWIVELSTNLGIQRDDLREMFYEVADLYKSFPFSLTTGIAWRRLGEALTEYDAMVAAKGKETMKVGKSVG
jgi:DNA-directed RNA polymerase subunit M/transcription elongation factor TFIIS